MRTDVFDLNRDFYVRWVKPIMDRVLGLLALAISAPLLIGIATIVRLKMGSPVILRQRRMGRFNVPFTLYKFRTMEFDRRTNQIPFVGGERRLTHKSPTDPRITELGRWLRATRLDELPQLVNVVLGDLSVVGPRPELVSVVRDQYEPWQYRRHAVKPGLTGLWQIARESRLLHECTEMELEYLIDISLANDMQIIIKTIPAMARRSGF